MTHNPFWPPNASDEQIHQALLVAQEVGGESRDYAELIFYGEFFIPVFGFVRKKFRNLPDEAVYDAVTQAFMEFLRQGGVKRYDAAHGTLVSYLIQTVFRRCLDVCKRRKRKQKRGIKEIAATDLASEDEDQRSTTPGKKQSAHDVTPATLEILRAFLESIQDPTDRQIFQFFYVEGKKCKEIAELMTIPNATVSRRRLAIDGRLEKYVEEWLKTSSDVLGLC